MKHGIACWKCGAELEALTLPFGRRDECPACRAELHVCRLCEFYDRSKAKHCREPIADEVSDKTRANFCGYFRARPGAWQAPDEAASRAKAALDSLFGGPK